MKPYYEHAGITIYHGDCRHILPRLEADAVITDPVWPNSSFRLQGFDRPWGLFGEMCAGLPASVRRLVVQLGCNSDPRFLVPVPSRLAFIRTCWLDYVTPS